MVYEWDLTVNFLEARQVLAEFTGGPELSFLFALSGTPDPFSVYLQAAGAKRGLVARPRFLPFNTLRQHLVSGGATEHEVVLLLPWDLAPETDWRSGVPRSRAGLAETIGRAEEVADQLQRRSGARVLYLPCSIAPVIGHASGELALQRALDSIAARLQATTVPAEVFSLGTYFASGCPVGGGWLGRVAELAIDALTTTLPPAAKVLVTDLDNTLWAGVIAEDGPEGIRFRPEGAGYRHYVYQTMLVRLRREGIVLAAVSRNDATVVLPPLRSGQMPLAEDDFVAVCASYHAKSAQIKQLAGQLNLGLDSFVFVDDNPVEREEVHQALPGVHILAFPDRDHELPALVEQLSQLFGRQKLTVEDRERTELYRRRLQGLAPVDAEGADLSRFLADLEMRLVIHDRSKGDRSRAIQLINKTNQFNANGRRWNAEEIGAILDKGGRLFGATLADRSGSHGEIISCLLAPDGVIEAFVMSCRVFQRRVEFAFLAALASRGVTARGVRFTVTERNGPFVQFSQEPAFGEATTGVLPFDAPIFASRHHTVLELFEVAWD